LHDVRTPEVDVDGGVEDLAEWVSAKVARNGKLEVARDGLVLEASTRFPCRAKRPMVSRA
jgi:hypothetical protein